MRKVADLEGLESNADLDTSIDLKRSKDFNLWGVTRAPRNITAESTGFPAKFRSLERGLQNLMDELTKQQADSGEVLFMIDGTALPPSTGPLRVVALLTGTSYSPKVCDLATCRFKEEGDATRALLDFPFDVRVALRPNRVSDKFKCMDLQTSSEFVARLTKQFSHMRLRRLHYKIPLDIDGSLLWSRVEGDTDLGVFWAQGQRAPWTSRPAMPERGRNLARDAALLGGLAMSDPFEAPPAVGDAKVGGVKRKAGDSSQGKSSGSRRRAQPPLQAGEASSSEAGQALVAQLGDGDAEAMPCFAGVLGDDELDMAEHDFEDLDEQELIEFEATLGEDVDPANAPDKVIGDVVDEVPEVLMRPVASEETTRAIADKLSLMVDEVGLGADDGETVAGNASASSDAPAAESVAEDAPPPQPWEAATGPSTSGYVHHQGRSVLRIQRGKPKGRVTITCYQHTKCNLLVNIERAPSDDVIKRWAFEVDATPRGASKEEAKALRDSHVKMAKDRWSRPLA